MPISKGAKDYAKSRIREIAGKAMKKAQPLKEPCLSEFLNAAILEGTAKARPGNAIVSEIRREAMQRRGYRETEIAINKILVEPEAYQAAYAAFKKSERATDGLRIKLDELADQLIDKLMLDGFESGQEAIQEMELQVHTLMKAVKHV